jgi:PAS domain S-box-containing protein
MTDPEEELRNREALLARAEQLAHMGSWERDKKTNSAKWSDNMYRILGFEPGEVTPTPDRFWSLLSAEDKKRAQRCNEEAVANRRPTEYEVRCCLADGRVRILLSRVVPVFSDAGELLRVMGTTQDVTDRRHEEDRLRRNEAMLAQAEQLANMGSWEWNLETSEVTWSEQRYRLSGMAPRSSVLKIDGFWKLLHPADRERVRMEIQRAVAEARFLEFRAKLVLPSGEVRMIHTRAVPTVNGEGRAIRLTGMSQDITEETQVKEDLHRLSQELMRTQDDERRQLARELHESACQTLAALKMILANLEDALPEDNEEAKANLKAARGFAEDAVREVRVVSYLMYPPLLDDAGLAPALQWYVRGFSERSGIKATVEIPSNFGRHPQEIETTLFRIVQEALTNVHRYSGSRKVTIRLVHDAGHVLAEIQDAGSGMPIISPLSKTVRLGVGIAGIRERVAQLNGTFEIESVPGRGTTLRAILPAIPAVQGPLETTQLPES